MAWPSETADDSLSGEGAGGGAVGTFFYDRDRVVAAARATWPYDLGNMTTTLADASVCTVQVPDWFLTGAEAKLRFRAYEDGAFGTNASFRLRETGGPTNGTTLVTALTATADTYEVVGLTAPDDSWAGAVVTFALQVQRPGSGADGNWFWNFEDIALNLAFEPA